MYAVINEYRILLPYKKLRPSRHEINAGDLKDALKEFKQEHLEVNALEGGFQIEDYKKVYSEMDISKLCNVLIALNYADQKAVYQKLRLHLLDHFELIGKNLENNYSSIKQIKSKDYLSNLKKAIGDSLMMGGWELKKETGKGLFRRIFQIF